MGFFAVFLHVGEQQDRNIAMFVFNIHNKFNTCLGILNTIMRKFYIRNNTKHVFFIALIKSPGFFIGSTQQDFWSGTHAQESMSQIYTLRNKSLRLVQHFGINNRKERGIISYAVFYNDYSLNADHPGIMVNIHDVFKIFYYCNNYSEVPLPDKNFIKNQMVFIEEQHLKFFIIMGKKYDRNIQP